MKKILPFVKNIILALIILLPGVIFAQNQGLVKCNGPDCDFAALVTLLNNIIRFLYQLALALGAFVIAYGGWMYFTAAGNMSKVSKGHEAMKMGAVGLIVVLLAFFIIELVLNVFNADIGFITNIIDINIFK